MSGIGDFVHLVSLAKAGPTPDDPEGGYDRTWIALDPPTWYCSISAASARDLEQISGGLYAATATHLIRGRYHPQLAPDCRITFRDRVFEVASVQNQDQQLDLLLVVATELIGVAPVAPLPPQPPAAHAPTHQPGGTDPIGPQVPAAHAATHASGGTDPLPAPTLPADVVVAGSVAVGTNPATSGAIRLGNAQRITGRNAANTADQHLIRVNSDDTVNVGDPGHLLILESPTVIAQNDIMSGGNMLPNVDNVRDVGRADLKWKSGLFGTSVAVGTNPAQSGAIRLANNQGIMARNAANTGDLPVLTSDAGNRVAFGSTQYATMCSGADIVLTTATAAYTVDGLGIYPNNDGQRRLGYPTLRFTSVHLSVGLDLKETPAPAAPAADCANLWLQDNGAGKSQLMIQFATGAPIAIATQP